MFGVFTNWTKKMSEYSIYCSNSESYLIVAAVQQKEKSKLYELFKIRCNKTLQTYCMQ